MKLRKLFAALLAVLMLAVLLPGSIFAESEKLPEEGAALDPVETANEDIPEKGNMDAQVSIFDAANNASTYLTYTTSNMTAVEGSTLNYVQSTIAGQAGAEARLTTQEFYMSQGETISFQYWYETEQTHDVFRFTFTKNGEADSLLTLSGSSNGWKDFSYNCLYSGTYTFTWRYTKDTSVDAGADCIRIRDITYSRHYDTYCYRAALSPNGNTGAFAKLTFNSGNYNFVPVVGPSSYQPLYMKSTNSGHANTTSIMEAKFYIGGAFAGTPSSKLKFQYAISSERDYDTFTFYIDDVLMLTKSGTDDYSWYGAEYVVTGEGMHTARWVYQKDGSTDSGVDTLCIDNVSVESLNEGYERAWFYYDTLNDEDSDSTLVFNTPAGAGGFVPAMNPGGNDAYVCANNRYMNSSDAVIETNLNMDAGETVSFWYKISSESTYDKLTFYSNATAVTSFSGWNTFEWGKYTYTAPSRGNYTLKWEYHKDSSSSRGYDMAILDQICYTGTFNNSLTLTDVLNAGDTDEELIFYTNAGLIGIDEFRPVYASANSKWAISCNKYFENTSSMMYTAPVQLNPGDTISFSYWGQAEADDKIHFHWDGPVSGEQVFSSSETEGWEDYTLTISTAGSYTFEWEFVKDETMDSIYDAGMVAYVDITRGDIPTLDEVLNEIYGDDMHFTTGEDYDAFIPYCYNTDWVAMPASCGGNGIGETNAYLTTAVKLRAGEKISFLYKTSLLTGSTLSLTANDSYEILSFGSSASGNNGTWHSVTYTAFTSGRYEFTWKYERPNYSYDVGVDDYVYIDNADLYGAALNTHSLDDSLNVEGGDLHFENVSGTTPWFSDWWFEDDIATAGNIMVSGCDSAIKTTVHMNAGDKLKFQYYVSSEGSSSWMYDYLEFTVNGDREFYKNGNYGWDWYTWTAPSDGNYTFEWRYHKDSSLDALFDCAKLDCVEVIRNGSGGLLGDVDGNGIVDTTDALYALRYALGIIDMPADWRERANVDGNSIIDTTDALLILRWALGIISHF
ncbi:MAG: dockerin type I repeat-containing protein [Clostridia bacterium]|nr:dockerin type I repeat-containing protein [Clostridia bacterium]